MGDSQGAGNPRPSARPEESLARSVLVNAIRSRAGHKGATVSVSEDDLSGLWEDLLDGLIRLTRYRLERGDILPGMEAAQDSSWPRTATDTSLRRRLLEDLIPASCEICGHEPHRPGECAGGTPGTWANCMCCIPPAEHARGTETSVCSACLHPAHPGGFCAVRRVDGLCPCEEGPRRRR